MIPNIALENIYFRESGVNDLDLLYRIYASTREPEMQLLTQWDEAMKQQFVMQQFLAQDKFYHEANPAADFLIILIGDVPAGRLYCIQREGNLHIIDISLLPEFRNKGYGSIVLRHMQEISKEGSMSLTIRVEKFNPAKSLYERLGFRALEDDGSLYLGMRWTHHGLQK